jgi:hypothetical protein
MEAGDSSCAKEDMFLFKARPDALLSPSLFVLAM